MIYLDPWRRKRLVEVDPSGGYEEALPLLWEGFNGVGRRRTVMVEVDNHRISFMLKDGDFGLDLCCQMSSPSITLAIVLNGDGYVVPVESLETSVALPLHPIVGYTVIEHKGMLLLHSFTDILHVGLNGVSRRFRLAQDELAIIGVNENRLEYRGVHNGEAFVDGITWAELEST